jgi:hypothetical protein
VSEHRSTAESYLAAIYSSDLRVQADVRTDADRLLAAAYAVIGDSRRILALSVYRLRSTGNMSGARQVAYDLGAMLKRSIISKPGGHLRRSRSDGGISQVKASDIAMVVLKWMNLPACPACGGRGHPMMENAPVMDESLNCPECYGTGVIPLERLVRPEHIEYARWMASEADGLSSLIFADMAKLMRHEIEI